MATQSPVRLAIKRLLRNRLAVLGLAIVALVLFLGTCASWIAPYDFDVQFR